MSITAAALQKLLDFGLTSDQVLEFIRALESSPPARGRYERAPRTKKYGPYQPVSHYWSDEKARAYAFGLALVCGPPAPRLKERDWLPMVGAVHRRDGFTCTYCGAGDEYVLHCDHIVPVSRGGPTIMENLTTACEYCNSSKRDALPHEWRPLTDA